MKTAFMNWSGGKDASYALWKVLQGNDYKVRCLFSSMNAQEDRLSMHGVRRSLIEAQAERIGLPLVTLELPPEPDMETYESALDKQVSEFRGQGLTHSIFGDIFLEDLRQWRVDKSAAAGIECHFPIWKMDTRELVEDFLAAGFRAKIVCVNEQWLGREFCGRDIDRSFLNDLPPDVDPCGENGEFHSFVYEGPIFEAPLAIQTGEIVHRYYRAPDGQQAPYGFYFCDLLPA